VSLELSQLYRLQLNPIGTVQVAHLPEEVATYLGCPLGIAYLSSKSLLHILKDHPDIALMDLLCLPMMIREGTWIGDRRNSACVVYAHPETGRAYKSALKATAGGYETYISTFHKCGDRQRASLLKRGTILRNANRRS